MHGSYISIIQFKGKSRLNGVEKDNGDGFVNIFFLYTSLLLSIYTLTSCPNSFWRRQ